MIRIRLEGIISACTRRHPLKSAAKVRISEQNTKFIWIFLSVNKRANKKKNTNNLPIDRKMEYISVIQFAEKYGISERTVRNYCAQGKIEGAFLTGKTWNIPADATLPKQGKTKAEIMPLSRCRVAVLQCCISTLHHSDMIYK